jgi:hypothetical protein
VKVHWHVYLGYVVYVIVILYVHIIYIYTVQHFMHTLSSPKKRSDSGVRVNRLDVSGFDLIGVFWLDLFHWFHSPSAFGLCHQISATAALDINTCFNFNHDKFTSSQSTAWKLASWMIWLTTIDSAVCFSMIQHHLVCASSCGPFLLPTMAYAARMRHVLGKFNKFSPVWTGPNFTRVLEITCTWVGYSNFTYIYMYIDRWMDGWMDR